MSLDKIIIKNAVIIALLIGGFFLISKLLGLEENPYLRFLNLIFVFFGIFMAIKESIYKNGETKYITNLGVGIKTSALAVFLSIIGLLNVLHLLTKRKTYLSWVELLFLSSYF